MDAAVTETRSTCIQRARPADDDKIMPIVPQRQGEGCKTQTIDGCDGVGVPLHHIIPMVIIFTRVTSRQREVHAHLHADTLQHYAVLWRFARLARHTASLQPSSSSAHCSLQ